MFIRFDSLTLPNGITRDFRSRLGSADAGAGGQVDRTEGTITGEGNQAGDARTVAGTAGMGASVGSIAGAASGHLGMGAGLGGAIGGLAGLASVLGSRGPAPPRPPPSMPPRWKASSNPPIPIIAAASRTFCAWRKIGALLMVGYMN